MANLASFALRIQTRLKVQPTTLHESWLRRVGTATTRRAHSATADTRNNKEKLASLSYDDVTGVATLSMSSKPVNALNADFLRSLLEALEAARKIPACRGLLLTSSLPVFSAGLDFRMTHARDKKAFADCWRVLLDFWSNLYGLTTEFPTVALVNGASPAGGCALSLACDYRVMLRGKHRIGLNETPVGIPPPYWLKDAMATLIGTRKTELALMRGSLWEPEEALRIGLIDEVASDPVDGLARCHRFIDGFAELSRGAMGQQKKQLRAELTERMRSDVELQIERLTDQVFCHEHLGIVDEFFRSKSEKNNK
ncbi:enoyl-CoA delta isomerase 1, mitochondrial-like [Trichogramma pretiosum]|uniref:enoyl-CoA delta isomerase 1, mitochondrial-like n=1 Tax=Trichogramma pretiosum TaxID=7493 RepID=UPI0006C9B93C|nr:enoyl-CoA delta isomerase 1, mitochondrial-like [Trichogramma pretiosum]